MIYSSTAIVKYENDKVYALVDQQISDYYRSLIPKYIYVQPQKYKAHITIVRSGKERAPNIIFWGKYEGLIINFKYDSAIKSDSLYFWLNVFSDDIGDIREELGLEKFRNDLAFGGTQRTSYHITIGNKK